MKELIKQLASEQVELKKKRKTGTLPELPRDYYGWIIWSQVPEEERQRLQGAMAAAGQVVSNKPRITAALNLYHELRGSDYRHNVPDEWAYRRAYEDALEEFRAELQKK